MTNIIPSTEIENERERFEKDRFEPGPIEPLSLEEKTEIEHEVTHYPYPQAATIEALKIVQKHQRWVSDGKVKAIAECLGISAEEVDGVATFYNKIYRRPVGEHVLAICDSVSCWMMGYPKMMQHACQKLGVVPGETTSDGRFTLLPTPCLGACDKGPVMMRGDTLIEHLTEERFDHYVQ